MYAITNTVGGATYIETGKYSQSRMNRQTILKCGTGLLVCCFVVILFVSIATGSIAAQNGLDLSIDAPQEVTKGEETTVSASVSVPDIGVQDHEENFTIILYVNEEEVETQTVTVKDGETTEVSFTHTFEESGEINLEVEGEVTIAGQSFSSSASTTVEVEEAISIGGGVSGTLNIPDSPTVDEETPITAEYTVPEITGIEQSELVVTLYIDGDETASRTIPVDGGESTDVDFTTVFESSGETTVTVEAVLTVGDQSVSESISKTVDVSEAIPETTTVEGAAFAVPKSLEDEVAEYRENAPQELDAQAFVLATQDELYIVFTQKEPTKGVASVEGPVFEQELVTGNLTYGVIAATSTSFETTGTEVGVQEVSDNSEQYRLELVRVNAHYRRVSTLTDPDDEEDFTLSTTSGVLVENPQTVESLFQNVGSNARALSRDTSTEQIDTILKKPQKEHLHTFSFETKFWADAEATVDAIVLDPQSAAQQFIGEYDSAGVAHAEDGEPILYVVREDFHPQQVDNVASIKSQSETLDGEVVETEVRLYQEKISVQETLEHNTGCNPDVLEIQTPQGPVCVNVVQDNLLHGGIAWNSIPQSREDALLAMGVNSSHQDAPSEFDQGRYRIKGEVVSTSRLSNTLPEGSILVIYDIDHVGNIDYESVAEEARSLIETRADELTTRLRQQVGEKEIGIETGRTTETIQSATPGEPATVTFSQTGPIAVQQARINVSSEVQDLKVDFSSVASLPSDVSQPPSQSIRVLNISTSAPENTIADASLQIHISSIAIPEEGDIIVYRYQGGEWNGLDTTVLEETDTGLVLTVETPGFSYFAVGTQTSDQTDSDEDQTDSDGEETDETPTDTGEDETNETPTDSGEDETGETPSDSNGETQTPDSDETTNSQSESEDETATETTDSDGSGFTLLTVLAALLLFSGWKMRK